MGPRTLALLLLVVGTAAVAPNAGAQTVAIYRCTDAAGQLTVQNRPCPAGSVQRVQAVPGVASMPMLPAAATAPPAPASAATAADGGEHGQPLDSAAPSPAATPDPLPPPPLFRCSTHDGDSYLAEDQEQPPRCVPLRTVGLDGSPSSAAGQACETVRDTCARVPDGGACEAWRRHAREAEARWRFAHPDNRQRRHDEYRRLATIVASTGCGG